jgi:hypothetical protein
MYIDLQLTDMLLIVDLDAIGQHVANDVTGNDLANLPRKQIVLCGI